MMSLAKRHSVPRMIARQFYPLATVSASVFFATTAAAQMQIDPTCQMVPDSQDSCVPIVACIGGAVTFVGGAYGWDTGSLKGTLSTGATCTGSWDSFERRAEFQCDNGQSGTVRYIVQDGETGTAVGVGSTQTGQPIEAWSGDNIGAYIRRETGAVTLQCGVTELPMS